MTRGRRKPGRRGGWTIGILGGVWAILPFHAQAASPRDLIGTWAGHATFRSDSTTMRLRFTDADSAVAATLDLEALHLRDYPMGPASLVADSVHCGPFRLRFDAAAGTLAGTLPAALVPVHEIPVRLSRDDRRERTERPALEAPRAEPAWTSDAGSAVWADLAYADGALFVCGDDGQIHAVDARTGAARWSFRTAGSIRARPTFLEGDLLVQADDGFLYRLDARRGRLRWKVRVCADSIVRIPIGRPGSKFDMRASAVTVEGHNLYLGTHDGYVLALDAARGERRWAFATGGSVIAAPGVEGGRVYAGSYGGKVVALEAATGSKLWEYDTHAPVTSTPVVAAGRVIVGSRSYDLLGLDPATGEEAWHRYVWFSWIESSARVVGRVAYLGSSDAAKVFALDAGTGRSLWESDVHGIAWGTPAVDRKRVFAATQGSTAGVDHEASVLALDPASGRALWRFVLPRPREPGQYGFAAAVAVGGGRVFAAALDGRVFAFDAAGPAAGPAGPAGSR